MVKYNARCKNITKLTLNNAQIRQTWCQHAKSFTALTTSD